MKRTLSGNDPDSVNQDTNWIVIVYQRYYSSKKKHLFEKSQPRTAVLSRKSTSIKFVRTYARTRVYTQEKVILAIDILKMQPFVSKGRKIESAIVFNLFESKVSIEPIQNLIGLNVIESRWSQIFANSHVKKHNLLSRDQ